MYIYIGRGGLNGFLDVACVGIVASGLPHVRNYGWGKQTNRVFVSVEFFKTI